MKYDYRENCLGADKWYPDDSNNSNDHTSNHQPVISQWILPTEKWKHNLLISDAN